MRLIDVFREIDLDDVVDIEKNSLLNIMLRKVLIDLYFSDYEIHFPNNFGWRRFCYPEEQILQMFYVELPEEEVYKIIFLTSKYCKLQIFT